MVHYVEEYKKQFESAFIYHFLSDWGDTSIKLSPQEFQRYGGKDDKSHDSRSGVQSNLRKLEGQLFRTKSESLITPTVDLTSASQINTSEDSQNQKANLKLRYPTNIFQSVTHWNPQTGNNDVLDLDLKISPCNQPIGQKIVINQPRLNLAPNILQVPRINIGQRIPLPINTKIHQITFLGNANSTIRYNILTSNDSSTDLYIEITDLKEQNTDITIEITLNNVKVKKGFEVAPTTVTNQITESVIKDPTFILSTEEMQHRRQFLKNYPSERFVTEFLELQESKESLTLQKRLTQFTKIFERYGKYFYGFTNDSLNSDNYNQLRELSINNMIIQKQAICQDSVRIFSYLLEMLDVRCYGITHITKSKGFHISLLSVLDNNQLVEVETTSYLRHQLEYLAIKIVNSAYKIIVDKIKTEVNTILPSKLYAKLDNLKTNKSDEEKEGLERAKSQATRFRLSLEHLLTPDDNQVKTPQTYADKVGSLLVNCQSVPQDHIGRFASDFLLVSNLKQHIYTVESTRPKLLELYLAPITKCKHSYQYF